MKAICPRQCAADYPQRDSQPIVAALALLLMLFLLSGCESESATTRTAGLPTSEPISANHVLWYLQHDAPQQPPPAAEVEGRTAARTPMERLMLGLSLAATADRGAEAPPLLAQALEADALEWHGSGRALVELLLRRTRAERHALAAREAADAALAAERVKRQELEMTLEALRQIDREMSEDNHE